MKGFAHLQTASDLLRKLQHDLKELRSNPDDVYVAFNFVVTAEHMRDWLHPGGYGSEAAAARKKLRDDHVLIRVVEHVANGAKHLVLNPGRHKSVEHVDQISAPYGAGSYGSGLYGGTGLILTLEGEAAEEFGEVIAAVDLAQRVVEFWQHRVST